MDWRKTLKKLEKAKSQDLRAALEALDAERETLESEIADLAQRQEAADLAKASGESGEDGAKLQSEIDDKRSTLRGMKAARQQFVDALSEAEKAEQQEKKKALEEEARKLHEAKGQKYNEAMELLAKAAHLLWEVQGGQYGDPHLVTGVPKIEMHKDPSFRAERSRLQEQAPEKSIETRLKQVQLELQELRG